MNIISQLKTRYRLLRGRKKFARNSDVIPLIRSFIKNDIVTVLDIGCGRLWDNNPKEEDILFSCFDESKHQITGIDISSECIEWRRINGPRGKYIKMDTNDLEENEDKFDLIIAHHIIEHMPKEKGVELLNTIEKMAKRQIIIGAPIGYTDTSYAVSLHNNPYERHICGWFPDEFKKRGYTIHIIKNVFLAFKNIEEK